MIGSFLRFQWIVGAISLSLSALCFADIRIVVEEADGAYTARVQSGNAVIFRSMNAASHLRIVQPDGESHADFRSRDERADGGFVLRGTAPGFGIEELYRPIAANLIERTITVTAERDNRYYIDFGWISEAPGEFYSFLGPETDATYSPSCSGPEFGGGAWQTFPFLGVLHGERLYGIIGDSPGLWENRCFMRFEMANRQLSLTNGDGSPSRVIAIPRELDATTVYRGRFDGWQHIESGESQVWRTWIFTSPARSLYDVQLAAHLALANAMGFNQSALEGILRNTSYLLLRRNLLRPESDYLFISGIGYGWKQWVTDGFYMSRGLDMPQYDIQAHAAVFYDRISYEDNAQYYLIWSVLAKRAGAELDMRTVDRAYRFMRAHEVDGLFIPPRLKPETAQFKTYHDLLSYEDGDAPSSNQGFHCGALMAARELGYPVTDEDLAKAKAGYARMFNANGGYMATSLRQQEHVGQDSLYGAVLTYCVFGEKIIPDDYVRTHIETTMRIQSPYGMRVISKANGDLLDGHSGEYVFGGSWFLNDGANYLAGQIHGMDPGWIDERLLWRLEKELAFMPAFHESISTVTGRPHGHHLYSWNSGFWWLRREVLKRMNMEGPDRLAEALDQRLGVTRRDGMLVLAPVTATLRPR